MKYCNIGCDIINEKVTDGNLFTVERYLEGLMESFILYRAKRYNIRGKQYLKTLEKMLSGKKVVALGEIGLDYYYDLSPRDVQKRVMAEQVEPCRKRGLILKNVRKAVLDHVRYEGVEGDWIDAENTEEIIEK